MLDFDERNGVVVKDGQEIRLTPRESELFARLWDERPNFVPTPQLEAELYSTIGGVGAAKVYVKRLRSKGVPIESREYWGYRVGQA